MTATRRFLRALLVLAALLTPVAAQEAATLKKPTQPVVDLAICLDTSGSMEGLIDSARQKIWSIVNDLALAKPAPRLRVALLSYGNTGNDPNAGWVKVESELTEDLDLISARLFALRTNGGTELVGRVLQKSLLSLKWHQGQGLKLIVVAGNESADQDKEVPFRAVCKQAITGGIMVNSIYCTRNEPVEIAQGWKEVALLADGHYAAIDQNRGTVVIATPFDGKLSELSVTLNKTYVPWGKRGLEGQARQTAADKDARKLNQQAEASRAKSKSSHLYRNSWCLVDALRAEQVKLEDIKQEDLLKELQGKTIEELRAYLDAKLADREKIQAQINDLHKQRAVYISAEMAKKGTDEEKAFDAAVRKAIRSQAKLKGFEFESE
jgi:hypothetical protein